jgi:hypothetical protein
MVYYGKHNQWPDHLSKSEANYHADLLKRLFHDMGPANRLQIPQNCIASTTEISKGGPL